MEAGLGVGLGLGVGVGVGVGLGRIEGLLPCALERRLAAEAARLEHVLRGAMEHQRRARPAHTGHPHLVRVRELGVGC